MGARKVSCKALLNQTDWIFCLEATSKPAKVFLKFIELLWNRIGGAASAEGDNEGLIDSLNDAQHMRTRRVEQACSAIDRGDDYPEGCGDNAWKDVACKPGKPGNTH